MLPRYLLREDVVLRRVDELRPKSIVEIGCGGGEMLLTLAKRGYSGVGYDLSQVSRDHARERLRAGGDRFQVVDEWPSTERFDLVLLLEVVGYAPDPVAMLRDCRALLAPGGSLVVTFARTNSGYAVDVVQGMRFFGGSEMRGLLREAGFDRIDLENYGFPLANALVPLMNRVHRARMEKERGQPTAVETGLSHYSSWFKPLGVLSNRITLRPFIYAQRLFSRTELGNGFLACASTPP